MAGCHATLTAAAYAIALEGCDRPLRMALLDCRSVEIGPKAKAR